MKIKKFIELVPNQDLQRQIFAGKEKVKNQTIAGALFQSDASKRDQLITQYINALLQTITTSTKEKRVTKSSELFDLFMTAFQAHRGGLSANLMATINYVEKQITEAQINKNFQNEWCALKDLKIKSQQLQANDCKHAKKLSRAIQKSTQDKSTDDKKQPCDGANDVSLANQNYLLTICPRNHKDAGKLLNAALKRDINVLVSAHDKGEIKGRVDNFWETKALARMSFEDGWKVVKVAERVLATGKENGKKTPQLVESTLVATLGDKRRTMTHLHHRGWVDGETAPDEQLVHALHDRMQTLNPSRTTPFFINCRAGVGRTGTVAVSYYVKREIERQIALGRNLDDIRINIPAIIQAFRGQRKNTLRRGAQIAQVYSLAGDHYARLSQK